MIHRLSFYIFYGFNRFLSFLPVKWLYAFSTFAWYIIYYIFPYRKKLVIRNLNNSFPEKSEKEIRIICKDFYHHLCDSFLVEPNLTAHLAEEEIKKRFVIKNPELCTTLFKEGKSINLMMAHYGNWEYLNILPGILDHKVIAIYKPIHNKFFDQYYKKVRSRFGVEPVPLEKVFRKLMDCKKKNVPSLTIFIADQRPRWAHIQHWIKFLHQDTPVILGAEKIAKKMNHSVIFLDVRKTSRGYYEGEFILICEQPNETEPYEITETYFKILEERIIENPELWLWSHKRWKHDINRYIRENRMQGKG